MKMKDVVAQVKDLIREDYDLEGDLDQYIDAVFTDLTYIPLKSLDEVVVHAVDRNREPNYIVVLLKDGNWAMVEHKDFRGVKDPSMPEFILRGTPPRDLGFYTVNQDLRLTIPN